VGAVTYEEVVARFGTVQHETRWAHREPGDRIATFVAEDDRGVLAAPLVLRENERGWDGHSPAGQAGVIGNGGQDAWERLQADMWERDVVAAFVKVHAPAIVPLVDEALPVWMIPPGVGADHASSNVVRDARRAERLGWRLNTRHRVRLEWWQEFTAIYAETMAHVGADEQYVLDLEDWLHLNRFEWYVTEARKDGVLGAAGVYVRGPGPTVHLYGATADAARADSPFKLTQLAALEMERERGLEMGKGSESLKERMGAVSVPAGEARLVLDRPAFEQLAAGLDSPFFPPWRG
jgi:hypothetical protein